MTLTEALPQTVQIQGVDVPIRTDFRVGIRFTRLLSDRSVPVWQAGVIALQMYYPDPPADWAEAFRAATRFYACGARHEQEADSAPSKRPVFDFDVDAGLIYAAFLEQYQIDLTNAALHWWQFRALLDALHDCMFCKVVGWRSQPIDDKLPPEEQRRLRDLKRLYALPDNRTLEEKQAAFEDAFSSAF